MSDWLIRAKGLGLGFVLPAAFAVAIAMPSNATASALANPPVTEFETVAAQPAAPQPAAKRDASVFRIVAFGSSSTQGIGATSPAATYPAQLEKLFGTVLRGDTGVVVMNRGIGGEDIDDMAKRLAPDVLARKPDLVIWQVGSNDPLRRVPLDRFKSELRSGIATIRRSGAEVILMEPQWSPMIADADGQNRFVGAVRDLGAEAHVDVIRRFDLMRRWIADGKATERELVGADRLHMTDLGYAMLSRAVFDAIAGRSAAFRVRFAVPLAAARP